jgi:hypothetical protein
LPPTTGRPASSGTSCRRSRPALADGTRGNRSRVLTSKHPRPWKDSCTT